MVHTKKAQSLIGSKGTQQTKFVGHVMHGHSLEHILTTESVKGARGSQRERIWDGWKQRDQPDYEM